MAKYSTDSGSTKSNGDDACELCGKTTETLTEANVAGATISVCNDCVPHGTQEKDNSRQQSSGQSPRESQTTKDTIQKATRGTSELWDSDTSHWESSGAGYQDDPLPYLVDGYGDKVRKAREEEGLTEEELARSLGVAKMKIIAIENGSAVSEDVTGSTIKHIEESLDISIQEE